MSDEHEANLRRLAELLQTSAVAADDPMRRLAEALVPDASYSHEQAEQDLPDYVSDELLGRPVARLYPALHRHLLQCETCAEMHAGMLSAFDEVPIDVAIPAPRLDFLPPIDIWQRTKAIARIILGRAWPAVREPFDAIAELARKQIEQGNDMKRLRSGMLVPTFSFGGGDAPITLRVLAATYIANQTLASRYGSLEQAAAGLPAATTEIAALAMAAAKEAGIARKERQGFVDAYLALMPGQPGASWP